jgi:para-aminobenzoate synthetase
MSRAAVADAISAMTLRRQPACGTSRVVAIDGPSGSGKTDLAACWTDDPGVAVLHLEDLYPGWHGLDATPRMVADVLADLAAGRDAAAPTWDWDHGVPGPLVHVSPPALLVVEGVGAGASVVRPFVNVLVWVEAPEQVRHERAMDRDGDTFAPWWSIWAEQEQRHFAREATRAHADVVVST